MHHLHLEEFRDEPGDGSVKTFTLREHQRVAAVPARRAALILEDTLELFNLVSSCSP
jgi:hypothetical protein